MMQTQSREEYTADYYVTLWMQNTDAIEDTPGRAPGERQHAQEMLENQVSYAFGFAVEDVDELTEAEQANVDRVAEMLGRLTMEDPDEGDLQWGRTFAYALWKDAKDEEEKRILEDQATRDSLTGLPNRRGMSEMLGELITHTENGHYKGLALLIFDLDKFKDVNDTLGHTAGDRLLVGFADTLRNNTRIPPDVIAYERASENEDVEQPEPVRTGGDEFLLAVPFTRILPDHDIDTPLLDLHTQMAGIAERLTGELTGYLEQTTEGRIPGIGVSIGSFLWEPGMGAEAMIERADQLMYEIKEGKKRGGRR